MNPCRCRTTRLALLLLALPAGLARAADENASLPAGGVSVVAEESTAGLKTSGATNVGSVIAIDATGQSFSRALRVQSLVRTPTPYGFQVKAPVTRPIAKGDMLFVEFWLRGAASAAETGEASSEFVLELNAFPNTKAIAYPVSAGTVWRRFRMPFQAPVDYPANSAVIAFRAGYGSQTYELGGVHVLDFGKSVARQALPATRGTYDGIAPDAPWRAAADARIDQLRKADLTVRVRTADGRTASGAAVTIEQQRHAFRFGTAAVAGILADTTTTDAAAYRAHLLDLFNTIVFENDLKWDCWDSPARRIAVFAATDWCRTNGLTVRGHNLVWPSWRFTPKSLRALETRTNELRQAVLGHVREEAAALRGRGLAEWDVINEPYSNHDLMDILGRDAMVSWFKAAHEADPDVRLYLNDYASLVAGGAVTAHKEAFEETARWLKASGAPIGGLGLQCHFGSELTPPRRLLTELDRLQTIGLPLTVTEWDLDLYDEDLQAAYTRDFLTVLFSHPAVDGVLMWGFWEGRHWRPNAAVLRKDWTIKPNGEAWRHLTKELWWTRATGTTDAAGTYRVRAFQGVQRVTVRGANGTISVDVALPPDGTSVDIVVP